MSTISQKFHDFGRDPFLDWVIIVSVSSVIAVTLVVLGILSYMNLNAKLAEVSQSAPPVRANIDKGVLDKVLQGFDDRAVRRAGLMGAYKGPSDPSL